MRLEMDNVGNAFRPRSPRIGKLPTQYACICALSLKGCRVERERQQDDQILHVRELDELQDVVARVASSRRLVPTLGYVPLNAHSVVKTFFSLLFSITTFQSRVYFTIHSCCSNVFIFLSSCMSSSWALSSLITALRDQLM